jgi:hypothetical protein
LHRLDLATGQLKIYRSNPGNPHGLGDDLVPTVHVSASGEVWAGTQNGLNRLDPDSGTFAAYNEKDGLSGNAVSCILEDNENENQGTLWMSTNRGLSRFDPRNKAFSNYSFADGLPGNDLTGWASCFKSPTGEMFFGGFSGGVAFYPDGLDRNSFAPPVALTEFRLSDTPVEVGDHTLLGKSISYTPRVTLSHEQTIFSLGFSALSYRNPANNRYRYKLEGLDNIWHEAGSDERLATYTTLPAGIYTFRLQGATSRGRWSEPGVKLEIEILPPMWKTAWFLTVCGTLILTSVWALYRVRVHQIARHFNLRLEERVGERTRIARDLHDTLLQSFQGLMLRFQVVDESLPPGKAKEELEKALDLAALAITEGRDTVQGLRSSTVETNDLARAIGALGEDLAGDETNPNRVECSVVVEGTARDLHPILRDEVYRIAGEALRNAFRHAHARRIEVAIGYGERQFRLRVRDDGNGIDPEVLDRQARNGHFGLPGMRERAELIGGNLEVWSQCKSGTEVGLNIPASIAYAVSCAGRGSRLLARMPFMKKTGTNS